MRLPERRRIRPRCSMLVFRMDRKETELEMVRRHVRQGERTLASQRALIARLRTSGLSIREAEILLVSFEDIQRQHEEHLKRVESR